MNAWGELANAHGASRAALAACVVDLARVAVAVNGLPTLLLPAGQGFPRPAPNRPAPQVEFRKKRRIMLPSDER